MKKLNLIKRLWTDSHEKQKVRGMQKYCILLLLLFTCVTHAWAKIVYVDLTNQTSYNNGYAHIHVWTGSQDKYYSIGSPISGNLYQITIDDNPGGWRLCHWKNSSRQDDCNWISDNSKNLFTIANSGNTGTVGVYSPSITVTYDGNDKSSGSVPTDATVYNSGDAVTVAGNTGNMTKSGYVFAGWNTAANGTGTYYAPGATFSITAATTLYAVWFDNNVLSGTNVMFYAESYDKTVDLSDNNGNYKATTNLGVGLGFINIAKSDLSSYYYITNNKSGSWGGNENVAIKSANGGERFVKGGEDNVAAKTAATTWDVDGDVLSLSTTCNSAIGVYSSKPLYILYYVGTNLISVTYSASTVLAISASTSAQASTYNASGLSNGSHTLKTILTDGLIYYIADTDDFTVAHTYSITYKDQGNVAYSGSNEGSLPSSYTYGTGIASLTDGEKEGYDFDGWFDDPSCTGDPVTSISTSATGNKTLYAKWTESVTPTISITSYPTYLTNSGKMALGISYANIPSGYCYRVKAGSTYYNNSSNASYTAISGTGTSSYTSYTALPVGSNSVVVELWNGTPGSSAGISSSSVTVTVETLYSVTLSTKTDGVVSTTGGSVSTSSPVYATAHIGADIVAGTENTGYAFTGWTASSGSVSFQNTSSKSTKVYATAAGTAYANYAIQSYSISSSNTNVTYSPSSGTTFTYGSTGDKMTITPKSGYKITDIDSDNGAITASADNNAAGSWTVTGTMPGTNVTLDITTASVPEVRICGRFRIYNSTRTAYSSLNGTGNLSWTSSYSDSHISMTYNHQTGCYDLPTYRTYAELKADNDGGAILYVWPETSSRKYGAKGGSDITAPTSKPASANIHDVSGGASFKFDGTSTLLYVVLHFDMENLKFWISGTEDTEYSTTFYAGEYGSISADGTAISANSSASVDIGFERTLTATPSSASYNFIRWETTGSVSVSNSTSASTKVTATGAGGTVTAVWGVNSGWYCIGDQFGEGDSKWQKSNTAYPFDHAYPGETNVFYREVTFPKGTWYFRFHNSTDFYGSGDHDKEITKGSSWSDLSQYNTESFKFEVASSTAVWVVIDVSGDTKKIRIQDPYYKVTFGDNLGGSAVSAVDGSLASITSGSAYAGGTAITFSKSDPAGYDFVEWNTAADGSGTQLGTGSTYSVASLSEEISVYAIYEEHDYTVTVSAGAGGSVSTTSVTAGPETESGSITATANTGYYFTGWTYSVDGKVTEHQSSYTGAASTLTINATAAVTMTANFAVRYALVGATRDDESATAGMPGWSSGDAAAFTYSDGTYTINRTLTKPNTNYSFKVIDRRANEWIWYGLSTADTWIDMNTATNLTSTSNNANMYSLGTGSYTFTVTEQVVDAVTYPRVTISNPSSWQVHMGAVTDNGQTGGSATAVDGESNTIVNENWVKDGGSVTFTHSAAAAGYEFVDWRTSSTYGDGSQLGTGSTYTASSIEADVYAYAHFKETKHTISLGYTGEGEIQDAGGDPTGSVSVGTYTTATITAVPASGYYFNGWTIPDGVTVTSGSSSTAEITIKTTSDDKTVTANFHADDKIYFDNTYTQWANVYVYLFNSDVWYQYTPNEGVHPNWAGKVVGYAQMTKVPGDDNLYEYAYHNSSHNYSFSHVAFGEADQHDNTAFYDMHCAYRSDWHTNLPVYVATAGYELRNVTAKYHSGGYWRPYNPKAGESVKYYLDVFSGTADFQGETQFFKASGDGSLVAEVSARLTDANTTYTFGVHSDAGGDNNQHYAESTTITNDNSDNYLKLYKYNDKWNISVETSAEGIYTFVLSMEYDSLRFSVIYPASVGDYRLTYSYDSPAKTRSSDIMKKKVTDAGAVHTSMYVDPTNLYSELILERCSTITEGKPEWEPCKTFDHSYITSKFATKEVYEMDVTVSGTNGTTSTLSNIAKYTGPFYIKTDCAIGGWADYTKNAMDQNSINYSALDSKTFNYYFVKYIEDARKKYGTNGWDACNLFDNAGNKTNVKCVVANMYNNSISDTLKSDVITGDGQETLPMPGSVRFSYNSATNEIKRTYLNGSTCWADAFLLLTADKTIKTPADVSIAGNATTFADKNNWVYELQIKAPETTKVWLKATFNSTPQDLIGTSSSYQTLIGGSDAGHYQLLRIIYDFKTNKLIAAWEPDQGTVYSGETIDLASDVLMIHNRRTVASATEVGKIDDVTMINLTTGGGFTGIGRIYCAMRFQKTSADGFVGLKTNTAGSEATALTSAESYYRFNYWISFPYDVKMTDIFGIDGYGSKWRIQRYRGDLRAQNGWYLGDGVGSFWETVPMSDTEKLNAKEGYVLQLSPSSFRSSAMWNNSATERYLYFPSGTDISVVDYTTSSVTLTSLPCTKGTFSDPTQAAAGYSHNITDSHWHVFGIPTFYNATGTTGTGTYHNGDTDEGTTIEDNVFYFYEYNNNGTTCNTYTATSSSDYVFQPMHAYMIQMTGELNFTKNSVPASMAARRINNAQNYDITIELTQNETVTDRAFISIRDSASADFAFNEDMMKIHNSGKTNIYSFAGPYDVAANVLPKENRSIKLGIEASESGMYTIHVPGNFSGIATLFDNVENKRTNLALEDYEIFLEKGKYEDRFFIEIDLNKMPTAIDGVSGGSLKDGKAHKFIQNGQMYILQNGMIYDATGRLVK